MEFRLRVLAWLQSDDGQKKRNRPKPPEPIAFAHEKDAAQAKDDAKYAAHAARQAARTAQ